MANDSIQLYNFYKRYKWTAEDFTGWQTGMVEHSRGMFEGLFHGGVLDGLQVTPTTGTDLEISAGIASGPSGYLHVVNSVSTVTIDSSPSVRRDLIVLRPNLVNNTPIVDPTNPLNTVSLRTTQSTSVVVIKGTDSTTPEYPAKLSNDVVLAGVRIESGQTTLTKDDLDFEQRDALGKNTLFQQNSNKYDERCLVLKESSDSIRIKPSQTQVGIAPKSFLYVNKSSPSRFPLNASSVFTYADTLVSFQTGAITGGDEFTPDFPPTIPTSGNWIVATVSLEPDDSLNIAYGTEGSRSQCLSAIENATTVGAGSVALPSNMMRLAFVLLRSADGVSITEVDVIDARSTFYFGGPDSPRAYPNVFVSALGDGDTTSLATAVTQLPVAGGVIVVLDDLVVPTSVTLPENTKLIGRGKNATVTFTGASGLITSKNVVIEDIVLAATGATDICILNGDNNVVSKCRFEAPSGNASATCIDVASDGNHIGECVFTGVVSPSLATGINFRLGTSENTESNNIFST